MIDNKKDDDDNVGSIFSLKNFIINDTCRI